MVMTRDNLIKSLMRKSGRLYCHYALCGLYAELAKHLRSPKEVHPTNAKVRAMIRQTRIVNKLQHGKTGRPNVSSK